MDSHAAIEILLRSAHLNCNPKPLQHLPNTHAQNMQSHNLLLRPGTHKLHLRRVLLLLFGGEDVKEHRSEFGVVNFYVFSPVFGDRFWFGETCCSYFWVAEDDSGDVFVGEFGGFQLGRIAEEAVS